MKFLFSVVWGVFFLVAFSVYFFICLSGDFCLFGLFFCFHFVCVCGGFFVCLVGG